MTTWAYNSMVGHSRCKVCGSSWSARDVKSGQDLRKKLSRASDLQDKKDEEDCDEKSKRDSDCKADGVKSP